MVECEDQVFGRLNVIAPELLFTVIAVTKYFFVDIGTVLRLGISDDIDLFVVAAAVVMLSNIELAYQTELNGHYEEESSGIHFEVIRVLMIRFS